VHRTDVYYGLWNPSIGTLVLYTRVLLGAWTETKQAR
jgi:hypothetical protein